MAFVRWGVCLWDGLEPSLGLALPQERMAALGLLGSFIGRSFALGIIYESNHARQISYQDDCKWVGFDIPKERARPSRNRLFSTPSVDSGLGIVWLGW